MESVLTISQLAHYVGVSTRTVRYYHQRGLLPEPERTAGGYRTYDADAVIRLTKITTLARSGVPLARIEELLAADPDTFRDGVADIDRDLEHRIRELSRDREQLGHLQSGERLCLPTLVCEYLDDLREAGVPEPVMVAYRDSWLVTCAMHRDQVDGWIADFGHVIAHPEYVALQARTLNLHDLPPDDPAVASVSDAWVEWTAAHWEEHSASWDNQMSDPLADSIVASRWVSTAAWDRMGELIAAGLHARGLDHPALASHL